MRTWCVDLGEICAIPDAPIEEEVETADLLARFHFLTERLKYIAENITPLYILRLFFSFVYITLSWAAGNR